MFKKCIVLTVLITFAFTSLGMPPDAHAQAINLPAPQGLLYPGPAFNPLQIKGIQVYTKDPLRFDFLIDEGQTGLRGQPLKDEITRLSKYFLTSLTVPEGDLWVNLSPYEKDRIVPNQFGLTQMGKDLLEQDYILKQMVASLTYPETALGKRFWQTLYQKAYEQFGTTQVPVSTFNKVWIVPKTARVHVKDNSAFVAESKLDVMLDVDYTSLKKNAPQSAGETGYAQMYAQVFRDVILPSLRKEVNEGKNFAVMRQVYDAMILATWYKRHLHDSLLGKVYVGKNKVKGVDAADKAFKEKIFEQYLAAFKKRVYNYVKEDYDPSTGTTVPRKYVSGGWDFTGIAAHYQEGAGVAQIALGHDLAMASINLSASGPDGAIINFPDTRLMTKNDPLGMVVDQSMLTSGRVFLRRLALPAAVAAAGILWPAGTREEWLVLTVVLPIAGFYIGRTIVNWLRSSPASTETVAGLPWLNTNGEPAAAPVRSVDSGEPGSTGRLVILNSRPAPFAGDEYTRMARMQLPELNFGPVTASGQVVALNPQMEFAAAAQALPQAAPPQQFSRATVPFGTALGLGLLLAPYGLGMDSIESMATIFSLAGAGISMPYFTRILRAHRAWRHEVLWHLFPAWVLYHGRSQEVLTPDNIFGNLSPTDWVNMVKGRPVDKSPHIKFERDVGSVRDTIIDKTGFWGDVLLIAGEAVGGVALMLHDPTLLAFAGAFAGPWAASAWERLRLSWNSHMSSKRRTLADRYECGNFGLYWAEPSDSSAARELYPEWVNDGITTMLRRLTVRGEREGGQAAIVENPLSPDTGEGVAIDGIVPGQESTYVIAKKVKNKRYPGNDLISDVLNRFSKSIRRVEGTLKPAQDETDAYQVHGAGGHKRFPTGGPVFERASHPFVMEEERAQWVLINGKFQKIIKKVITIITHNGDNDEARLLDRNLTFEEMRTFYPALVHFKGDIVTSSTLKERVSTERFKTNWSKLFKLLRQKGYVGPDGFVNPEFRELDEDFKKSLPDFQKTDFDRLTDYLFGLAEGDSPPIATQIHARLNQGSWRGSVRWAHVTANHTTADEALKDILTLEQEDALAAVFEEVFARYKEPLSRPYFAQPSEKKYKDLWMTENMVKQGTPEELQYKAIEHFKQALVARLHQARGSDNAAGELLRSWNQDERRTWEFVDTAVEEFFTGDRFNAMRRFSDDAIGTYGLVLRTSLNGSSVKGDLGATILSRGQGMALGYNLEKRFFGWASEIQVLLGEFGSKGRMETAFILDPSGGGEMADISLSPTSGQVQLRVTPVAGYQEENVPVLYEDLPASQVREREYHLNEDNRYYKAPVEYADQKNMIDEDLQRITAVMTEVRESWQQPAPGSDEFRPNMESAEALNGLLISRFVEKYFRDRSRHYAVLRPLIGEFAEDLLDECGSQSPCSSDQMELLNDATAHGPDSLLAGIFMDVIEQAIAVESDRFAKGLLNKTMSIDQLNEYSQRVNDMVGEVIKKWEDKLRDYGRFAGEWRRERELALERPKQKVDIFITGYQDSLWLGENFAEMLRKTFPDLNVVAVSSNKFVENPAAFGITDRTVGIIISKSGSTYSTLAVTRDLRDMTHGNTFAVTGRMDSMINMVLGQRLNPDAPFTKRVFVTGNYYPSEAPSVAEVELALNLNELHLNITKRLREIFRTINPWGLQATLQDIGHLEALRDFSVEQSAELTGFAADGGQYDGAVNKVLLKRGQYLGKRVKETLKVKIAMYSFVMGVFWLGGGLIYQGLSALGMAPSADLLDPGRLLTVTLDGILTLSMPLLFTMIDRRFRKAENRRPSGARLGPPGVVIGDTDMLSQTEEAYVSKMGSSSVSTLDVPVYRGDLMDLFVAKRAHQVRRGTEIISGLPLEKAFREAFVRGLKQAKGITSSWPLGLFKGGAEITTVGHGSFINPDASDFHINLGDQPLPEDVSDYLQLMNYLGYDSLSRMIAYKVLFNEMYKNLSTIKVWFKDFYLWMRSQTFSRTSVHTTPPAFARSRKPYKPPQRHQRSFEQELQPRRMAGGDPVQISGSSARQAPGGIDMDSRLMHMETSGEDHIRFDDKAFEATPIESLAPQVGKIIPVTAAMVQQMLGQPN